MLHIYSIQSTRPTQSLSLPGFFSRHLYSLLQKLLQCLFKKLNGTDYPPIFTETTPSLPRSPQTPQTVLRSKSFQAATSSTFLGGSVSFIAEHINSGGTSITAAARHIDQLISWT